MIAVSLSNSTYAFVTLPVPALRQRQRGRYSEVSLAVVYEVSKKLFVFFFMNTCLV